MRNHKYFSKDALLFYKGTPATIYEMVVWKSDLYSASLHTLYGYLPKFLGLSDEFIVSEFDTAHFQYYVCDAKPDAPYYDLDRMCVGLLPRLVAEAEFRRNMSTAMDLFRSEELKNSFARSSAIRETLADLHTKLLLLRKLAR